MIREIIEEAEVHIERDIEQNKDTSFETKRELINSLYKGDYAVDIQFDRIDSTMTVNKIAKLGLDDYVTTAAMSKDFTERKEAQSRIKPAITRWLKNKDNVLKYTRNPSFRVSTLPDGNRCIEFLNKKDDSIPYLKFIKIRGKWVLKSFHDGFYTFKKKSYNDTRSYKMGDKETKANLKAQHKDASHFNY